MLHKVFIGQNHIKVLNKTFVSCLLDLQLFFFLRNLWETIVVIFSVYIYKTFYVFHFIQLQSICNFGIIGTYSTVISFGNSFCYILTIEHGRKSALSLLFVLTCIKILECHTRIFPSSVLCTQYLKIIKNISTIIRVYFFISVLYKL